MDSFKPAELSRMDLGGNAAWKSFWEGKTGEGWGKPGEGADGAAQRRLEKRYGGEVGEEYKERLGCKIEGKEFMGMPVKERRKMASAGTDASTARTASPHFAGAGNGPRSQKEQNEGFFSRKGNENANRPDGLAPSQGGKYAGFGSGPPPAPRGAAPGLDDFQQDPVAALTKGFGWFTKTVGQGAKTLNDGYIQPTAHKVCLGSLLWRMAMADQGVQIADSDLAAQARITAAQAAKNIQTGTKGAAEKFNQFVENSGEGSGSGGAARSKAAPERQDFWDSFGDADVDKSKNSSSIGTAAMRKGEDGGKKDGWGDW